MTAGARTVLSGGLWSLGASVITIVASLIATPFVLRGLGSEAYGVFSVVQVFVGYFAVADFGTGDASTRYSADAYARDDRRAEAEAVWTALLLQVVPSIIAVVGLTLGAWFIVEDVLRLPGHIHAAAAAALPVASLAMIAKNVATVFNSPQVVRLRFREVALINAGCGLVQIATVPIVVWQGGSIAACVAVVAGANALSFVVHATYATRLLPELRTPRIASELLGTMARYGGWTVVVTLVIVLLTQTEKVLIARFASPTALAYYAVAFSLASTLTIVPRAIKGVLFPIFSRMQADPSQASMATLYGKIVRMILLAIGPLAVVMCMLAAPFLSVWAGEEYGRNSAIPFYVLTLGFLASGMASIPVVLLKGIARVDLLARFNMLQVVPFVLLAGLLTWKHGAIGGAIAFTIRAVVDAAMHFGAVRQLVGVRVWNHPRALLRFAVACLLVLSPLSTLLVSSLGLAARLTITAVAVMSYLAFVWAWMDASSAGSPSNRICGDC